MKNGSRRNFVKVSAAFIGLWAFGTLYDSSPDETWSPQIKALTPGLSYNLAGTLPPSLKRGGVFSLDPSGSPLPQSIQLLPSGVLVVAENFNQVSSNTHGVIFNYTEPV